MSNRGFLAVLAAVGFVALLAYGLIAKGGATLEVGQVAPDGPIQELGGDGEATLSDYRGEWVLVNFWASWCKPCEEESPTIERYADEHKGEITVVGINSEDNTTDATEFVAENDLSWDFYRDVDDERSDDYGVVGLPETFLIDPEGNLALLYRGPIDQEYLDTYVTPLISGTEPA